MILVAEMSSSAHYAAANYCAERSLGLVTDYYVDRITRSEEQKFQEEQKKKKVLRICNSEDATKIQEALFIKNTTHNAIDISTLMVHLFY